MKSLILASVLALGLYQASLGAETPENTSEVPLKIKNEITLEPFGALIGAGTLRYERLISRDMSLVAGFKFGVAPIHYYDVPKDPQRLTLGAEAAFRYFPMKAFRAPRGLWVGLAGEFINEYFEGYHTSVRYAKSLVQVGWKLTTGGKICFVASPYLGIGYAWSSGGPVISADGERQYAPQAPQVYILGCDFGMGF